MRDVWRWSTWTRSSGLVSACGCVAAALAFIPRLLRDVHGSPRDGAGSLGFSPTLLSSSALFLPPAFRRPSAPPGHRVTELLLVCV